MARNSVVPGAQRRAPAYLAVAFGVALASWAARLMAGVPFAASLAPFSLIVALAAWRGGFRPGAASLLLSALALDYLFLDPGSVGTLGSAEDARLLALFLAGWLVFAWLADATYRAGRRDRALRVEADRAARQSDRISQLTTALGQARTPDAVVEAAIQEPLHALGADAGMLFLVAEGGATADAARIVGYPSARIEHWRTISLTERSPLSEAVGRGAPVIVESRARWGPDRAPLDSLVYPEQCRATVAVPLLVGSRAVAVVRLDFDAERTFSAAEREYLFALGPRAAQALDRTWQFEYAQRAREEAETLRARADQELKERQKVELALRASEGRYRALAARTSRLHGLTAALSEAVLMQAVGQAVVRHGKIVVGATTGEVALLTDNGSHFEILYAETDAGEGVPGRRYAAESGLCETEAVQTRHPVFVRSFAEWQERFWQSATLAADGGFVSSATLPLLVEGTAIGVLSFHFTVPVNFDAAYQALLVSVAQHCAQALDRARLYEGAQRARAQAEEANRLKDEFVSVVSHELRTPLNAILGWTAMLQRGTLDPAVGVRALQSIHDNATRQARLIDDLLDFSRMMAGRVGLDFEDIDLRDLMRGVVESMIPTAVAHGIHLQLAPVPPVFVRGDLRRLEQVFFNLLSNALKFTPEGGRVAIEVARGEQVEIRVMDNGIGIEPEFLPHAFDRFRQADSTTTRNHGGLGLGLSIARQLVEAHKGTISVSSAGRNRGTTFMVTLPVAQDRQERAEERPAPAPPSRPAEPLRPLRGVRVLVVDDEPDARDVIAQVLQDCGAQVTTASSTHQALEILEHQPLDVLLADIAMPGEDGYELIRKVRASVEQRVASIPAAAVTAHAREDERSEALAAGFHLHLAKPFEPTELTEAIAFLVRGDSVVH